MYEYRCTVKRILDGDTMDLDLDLGCDVHIALTVRLDGIDAPELKTGEGKVAKAKATTWITEGNRLTVHTVKMPKTGAEKTEKYGRYLGTIYRDNDPQSLNAWLLTSGLARPYDGGAR